MAEETEITDLEPWDELVIALFGNAFLKPYRGSLDYDKEVIGGVSSYLGGSLPRCLWPGVPLARDQRLPLVPCRA
ncbi:hypothetical protein G6O67_004873 [Ophiocordyceps sinensis]|uniref:Uncharacterized protein n=1 Tax=Ophiocordyceps sinensis TaxID=72228 RepID=A0A8H4PQF3_9HYPO|nr:hypothetical protein G6O67_004873 [Ophiocordyceps sinensis]